MNPILSIVSNKIVAVVRESDPEQALRVSDALISGGIKTLEVTTEKSTMLPVLKELSMDKNITVLAGGIITAKRAAEALENGAQVIVSPVFQTSLVKFCAGHHVPHIATVSTANEAYSAWKSRIPLIKLFPSQSMGGTDYLEDLLRPMPFLNIMAAGGISLNNFTSYLKSGASAVGLGRAFYQDVPLSQIKNRALFAVEELKKFEEVL